MIRRPPRSTLFPHDALPISTNPLKLWMLRLKLERKESHTKKAAEIGRSTRLNSSHRTISYAVFCLKKKNTKLVSIQSPHSSPIRQLNSSDLTILRSRVHLFS